MLFAREIAGGFLRISEFRLRGPNGPTDEFVEMYNNVGGDSTVNTLDGSRGVGARGLGEHELNNGSPAIKFIIPNGTIIPEGGHYLGVNSTGYSLGAYRPATARPRQATPPTRATFPITPASRSSKTANPANFTLAYGSTRSAPPPRRTRSTGRAPAIRR